MAVRAHVSFLLSACTQVRLNKIKFKLNRLNLFIKKINKWMFKCSVSGCYVVVFIFKTSSVCIKRGQVKIHSPCKINKTTYIVHVFFKNIMCTCRCSFKHVFFSKLHLHGTLWLILMVCSLLRHNKVVLRKFLCLLYCTIEYRNDVNLMQRI